VDFDDDAQLDTSQIDDRRGAPAPGGGRSSAATAAGGAAVYKMAGGGVVGLIAVVAFVLISGGLGGSSAPPPDQTSSGVQNLKATCQKGIDADTKPECRIVAAVNSVQAYWSGALRSGSTPYRQASTVFFTDAVSTGCGSATSDAGPFYCPADETVYLDLGFFDQLRRDFGAQGGPFAETYVIAHEYGHHVQHILGYDQLVGRDRSGPQSGSVKLELQADCLAGVWARNAVATGFVRAITQADIEDGLDAASVIGDDRIQQSMRGRINPEAFTHGTSEQRQRWLTTGYQKGTGSACNTWEARTL
jgi:predicted metalloprotease